MRFDSVFFFCRRLAKFCVLRLLLIILLVPTWTGADTLAVDCLECRFVDPSVPAVTLDSGTR